MLPPLKFLVISSWMTSCVIMTMLLLLLTTGHVSSVTVEEEHPSSIVCPSGTELDIKFKRCILVCDLDNSSNSSTDCKTWFKDKYHLVNIESNMSLDNIRLPACKNVTLFRNEFLLNPDGNLTVTMDKVRQKIRDFDLAADGRQASMCYPLSPQLLQCRRLRNLDLALYDYLDDRTLLNRHTNETIGFRDYYSSPLTPDMLACTEVINPNRRQRCNNISYQKQEYEFLNDDNVTIRLLPTNTTIYRPQFSTPGSEDDDGTIDLCYPFSPRFTTCTLWLLEKYEFVIDDRHRLVNTVHDIVMDMSEYFIQADGRAVVCSIPAPTHFIEPFDVYYVHAVLYCVSAVCLFVAFVVHLLVPSLNYHAKPLLCHMICMLVMYVALAIRKFRPTMKQPMCYGLFVTTYYATMTSFFWLNVLAFDLWTIFANLQTSRSKMCWCSCRRSKHHLLYYNVYAWGVPALFCVAVCILDASQQMQESLYLFPNISAMCWFNQRRSAYFFFYIPMFTVLLVNLLLFVSTIRNLRAASRGVEVVNRKMNKQLLFVCLKLFVIMGFCWVGEVITWTVGSHTTIYYLPDALNAAQGIIIFAIYICKPATYRLLSNKFFPRTNADGKWTLDFNTSKAAADRKMSLSSKLSSSIKSVSSNTTRVTPVVSHADSLNFSKL